MKIMEIIRKVTTLIEKYEMIKAGDLVAVGVSGGADSMCLLYMLLEYRKKVPFELIVVHVNHKIREEAGEDASYVESFCKERGISFFLKEEQVADLAKKEKLSEEEAGRKVRYQAFEEALAKYRKDNSLRGKIAVAHHQGDCAETMLFHLFRGTGFTGMAGILPVRDNIIRPILTLSRQEIEYFLKEKGIRWCIDRTNQEDTYTRNKIRHHILKYAEEEIVKGAVSHVAEAAMQMVQLREYLEEETKKAAKECTCFYEKEEKISIYLPFWKRLPQLIQNQVLLWATEQLTDRRKDMTSAHIQALAELTTKEGSRKTDLPYGLEGIKEYELLWIRRKKEEIKEDKSFSLKVGEIYPLGEGSFLELTLTDKTKVGRIEEKKYTKYLDYDKIYNYLTLRFRQSGDYLTINDAGQKKSLKKYFIEEKVPADNRDKIWLIADGKHILWVTGYRISSYYKVTEATKNILQMKIWRENDNGREN